MKKPPPEAAPEIEAIDLALTHSGAHDFNAICGECFMARRCERLSRRQAAERLFRDGWRIVRNVTVCPRCRRKNQ